MKTLSATLLLSLAMLATASAQQATSYPWNFAQQVSAGDQFEIRSSQMALMRSSNPRIRQFAQQMIQDHTATSATLAERAPLLLPAALTGTLNPRDNQMLAQLAASSNFDRDYAAMQVAAHREAVGLFTGYARSGEDMNLRSFAAQTLPTIKHHLAMAKRLR